MGVFFNIYKKFYDSLSGHSEIIARSENLASSAANYEVKIQNALVTNIDDASLTGEGFKQLKEGNATIVTTKAKDLTDYLNNNLLLASKTAINDLLPQLELIKKTDEEIETLKEAFKLKQKEVDELLSHIKRVKKEDYVYSELKSKYFTAINQANEIASQVKEYYKLITDMCYKADEYIRYIYSCEGITEPDFVFAQFEDYGYTDNNMNVKFEVIYDGLEEDYEFLIHNDQYLNALSDLMDGVNEEEILNQFPMIKDKSFDRYKIIFNAGLYMAASEDPFKMKELTSYVLSLSNNDYNKNIQKITDFIQLKKNIYIFNSIEKFYPSCEKMIDDKLSLVITDTSLISSLENYLSNNSIVFSDSINYIEKVRNYNSIISYRNSNNLEDKALFDQYLQEKIKMSLNMDTDLVTDNELNSILNSFTDHDIELFDNLKKSDIFNIIKKDTLRKQDEIDITLLISEYANADPLLIKDIVDNITDEYFSIKFEPTIFRGKDDVYELDSNYFKDAVVNTETFEIQGHQFEILQVMSKAEGTTNKYGTTDISTFEKLRLDIMKANIIKNIKELPKNIVDIISMNDKNRFVISSEKDAIVSKEVNSGYFRPTTYTIVIRTDTSIDYNSRVVLKHEIGHKFDKNIAYYKDNKPLVLYSDYSEEWNTLYQKYSNDVANIVPRGYSPIPNTREFFAEAFEAYLDDPKALKTMCPEVYESLNILTNLKLNP